MQRPDAVWLVAICLCELAAMPVFVNSTAVLPILTGSGGCGTQGRA
jgi:hypothetical protein